MKLGSLFSGVGGFDLGFERQGFEVAWQVEWDKHAQRVLQHHWPEVPLYSDIRDVDPSQLEWVDVITFGSPCQDLSVANTKREGLGGERSGLFHEAARIIKHMQPRFAVWENVPGALSSAHGHDFATVLATLVDAGAIDVAWRVLNGRGFGVPQERRRVFLVADFGGQCAGEVLSDSSGMPGRYRANDRAREANRSSTTRRTFRKSYRPPKHKPETWVEAEYANTLNAFDVGNVRSTVIVVEPDGPRRLTPREWESCLGFPWDWTLVQGSADNHRYRQLGNSVVVFVVEQIAANIAPFLKESYAPQATCLYSHATED